MSKCKECVDHKGKKYGSISKMCNAYEIEMVTFLSRMKSGMSLEEALTKETNRKSVRDHLGIEYGSFTEMCTTYNKSIDTVKYRLSQNWSLEDALTSEVNNTRISKRYTCRDHLGTVYSSKSEMCSKYNISKSLFDYRISHNWSLKDALTVHKDCKNKHEAA